MLDVLDLESRWKRYHFKKMLPRYISITLLLLMAGAGGAYYYLLAPLSTPTVTKATPIVKPVQKVAVNTKTVDKSVQETVVTPTPQNTLYPSFEFLAVLEDEMINYENLQRIALAAEAAKIAEKRRAVEAKQKKKAQAKKRAKSKKKPKKKKTVAKPVKKVIPKKVEPKKPTVTKPTTIVLGADNNKKVQNENVLQVGHGSTSQDELNSVIKRFNRSKKPALSLFIAKKYYENGNYRESYNYARKTYKLNPKIEDGFILYAQSLAKLGKKETAIAKLKPYIKKTGSVKAQILLTDIQKGKL